MIVVIPAKSTSSRVKDKNWRPFHQGQSLTDIKLEQVKKIFPAGDIYLSCEAEEKREVANRHGVQFLLRDPRLALDSTNWSEVVTGIAEQVPCDDDEAILWTEVCAPLFNEYEQLKSLWEAQKDQHDSLVVVKAIREFLIDGKGRAVNFNYGRWHPWSQDLDPLYALDASYIISKGNIKYHNYLVGRTPYLYELTGKSVEIDTPVEFEIAQQLYAEEVSR